MINYQNQKGIILGYSDLIGNPVDLLSDGVRHRTITMLQPAYTMRMHITEGLWFHLQFLYNYLLTQNTNQLNFKRSAIELGFNYKMNFPGKRKSNAASNN